MNDWAEFTASLLVYIGIAVVAGAVLAALWLFTKIIRRPWLPLQRIPQISWTGFEVILAFFILELVGGLVDQTLRNAGFFEWLYGVPSNPSIHDVREILWSSILARPLAMAIILLGLRQIRGTRLSALGISPVRAGNNFALGYVIWLIGIPITEVLLNLAVLATPDAWRDSHPINRITQQPLAAAGWLALFASASVVAPLTEEIMFRGLLLRWQLRRGWEAQATVAFCALFFAAIMGGSHGEDKPYNPAPVLFVLLMLPGIFLVPFLRFRRQLRAAAEEPSAPDDGARWTVADEAGQQIEEKLGDLSRHRGQPGVAIFANGLLFAAMHSNVWPSPIPLLLLGAALAWLSYRTSSLVAPITVHVLFNTVPALALLIIQWWK